MTMRTTERVPEGIKHNVTCRNCGEEFSFIIPVPPAAYKSDCPECDEPYDVSQWDE